MPAAKKSFFQRAFFCFACFLMSALFVCCRGVISHETSDGGTDGVAENDANGNQDNDAHEGGDGGDTGDSTISFDGGLSCEEELTDCGDICADLENDESNCGECGIICSEGESCIQGECEETGPGELIECNGEMVDPQTNVFHCGHCNKRCGPGVLCENGDCVYNCEPDPWSLLENFTIQKDSTAIHSIVANGVNLIEANGGYYIIGTCTGEDNENHNVISKGSDGSTLHAPGNCPGAPFSISYSGTNPLRISITVGPLPVDYKGLSVPFDPHKEYFTDFSFSGSGYLVGCGNNWSPRSGSGGPYTSIPQPCTIPGHGDVGLARVTGVPDSMWAEIRGPHATIRRVVLSSNLSELFFVNHPYTHNVEYSWGTEPLSSSHLPEGSVYHIEEDLYIMEPEPTNGTSDSQLVSYELPYSGQPGNTMVAKVTMCNSGSTTWIEPPDNIDNFRLSALPSNSILWSPGSSGGYSSGVNDQRIFLSEPVPPGALVTFDFNLVLPLSAGSYPFGARMVHDGTAWFGPEVTGDIQVTP